MKAQSKPTKGRSTFAAYYKAAKPALKYKWCYVVLTLISVALIAADLAFAQNSRELFELAPNIPRDTAITIVINFIIIIAIQFCFGFAETYVFYYFNESVIYAMRRSILAKIQRLTMNFFDHNHTAKITNTFFNQIEIVKDFVVRDVRNMIKLPLSFVLVGAYLFTVHPYLGITAVLASVLQPLSNVFFKKSFFAALDGERKTDNVVFTTMGEATHGIREVKINQIENFFDQRMIQGQKDGVKFTLARVKFSTLREMLKEVPTKAGYIVGISIGIYLMLSNTINAGDLVAFITLLSKVSEPFNGMTQTYSNFQKSLRSADDLLKLVDEPEEDYTSGVVLHTPIAHIVFNQVGFAYETDTDTATQKDDDEDTIAFHNDETQTDNRVTILQDVSFDIKGGSTVAIVGPSGSGKSTLIKLLYRFYDPVKGAIEINHRPISQYSIHSLRGAMAIVSQDIFIFDGTVRENLVLGREDVSEEEIVKALKYSQSYEFVQKLPGGLESNLGERGIKLSQGQKQRLSIARSILKKADIIILDEPTSALDVETEYAFQRNISQWAQSCTKIIIAHRLTTIRDADYILFLDGGTIIEQGTPQELIQREGKFKEYWEKQFLFQQENNDSQMHQVS